MLLIKIGNVLNPRDDDGGSRSKQRADDAVDLAADRVVVEAVGGD